MRVRWTALATLMAVVLLTAASGFAAKVLFEDKFTTLDPAWGAPSKLITVEDGKLIITGEKNLADNFLNQAGILLNDMEASYTMSITNAANPNYGSGLLFWARDYDAWYCILINANGWFAVQQYTAGRFLLPVSWRESDAISKGEDRKNEVKVVTKGNRATIFVNGKEIISFTGQPPQGGSLIGFRVTSGPDAPNTVAFSNFRVVQP